MKTEIRTRIDRARSARPWDVYTAICKYKGKVFKTTAIDRRKAQHDLIAKIAAYDIANDTNYSYTGE